VDSRQISIVQDSFKSIPAPVIRKIPRVILDSMFAICPETKSLFCKDTRQERKQILKSMIYIIEHLRDASAVGPYIKTIAVNLKSKNVQKKDYLIFGRALIIAISSAMGDDFKPVVKQAWISAYETISDIMNQEANK